MTPQSLSPPHSPRSAPHAAVFVPEQFVPLLQSLPWPAAVLDAEGRVWAANVAWHEVKPGSEGAPAVPHDGEDPIKGLLVRELGQGWTLRLLPGVPITPAVEGAQFPPNAEHGAGHASAAGHASDAARVNELTALARGLTHELRNPLSAILTAIELLQDVPELDEENAMLLAVVRKESRRMSYILTEFAAYARPLRPSPHAFDFTEATRATVRGLQHDIAGAQPEAGELQVKDSLDGELWVVADETQVRDALTRVMRNAWDAMNGHGDGALELSSEEGRAVGREFVTLCIEDSGPGFSVETLQRAFEPFFSTKPHEVGLGLPIARGQIEAAGGRLWLEVPESGGARVCLRLPRSVLDK